MRRYVGNAGNAAIIQQQQRVFTYSDPVGTSGMLAACIDLHAYVDALQISVGTFLDNEVPTQAVVNQNYRIDLYEGMFFMETSVLQPLAAARLSMMSLPPPKGTYFGSPPGTTQPILAWAALSRYTIVLTPINTAVHNLVSAQVTVIGLGYR